MSTWVIVGPHARPFSAHELFTSYILFPVLDLVTESMFKIYGLTPMWLLPLNFFLYHAFVGKITRGTLSYGIAVAVGAFLIEQSLALWLFWLLHI